MDLISSPWCRFAKRSKRKKQTTKRQQCFWSDAALPPALPQRAPSLGTYVRCSVEMANGNVCFLQNEDPSIANYLLAASDMPLWPSALEADRERESGVDVVRQENLRHAELSAPFFYCSIRFFLHSIHLSLFHLKNTIKAPFYIRLLHQTSKLLSSPLCFSL